MSPVRGHQYIPPKCLNKSYSAVEPPPKKRTLFEVLFLFVSKHSLVYIKKLACSIYDSTNSWRDNATRHMHPYHRYMCRSAVPGPSTHTVHIVSSLSNASRDPPLSIYLEVTSRYFSSKTTHVTSPFTAEPPVYQRNQRRYHVKKVMSRPHRSTHSLHFSPAHILSFDATTTELFHLFQL
jgi:hypothetical protein